MAIKMFTNHEPTLKAFADYFSVNRLDVFISQLQLYKLQPDQ